MEPGQHPEAVSAEPTESDLRAVVGPRADRYLRKWAKGPFTFNWAAFLLSGLWLPYRKMYRIAAIFYAAVILESLAEELIFVEWLGRPEVPRAVERGVTMALCVICGRFGNAWYESHVRRVVAEERLRPADEDQRLTRLKQR